MKLVTFTLQGYRRFVDATSVKLHNDLVAFVGPNEAGKSSILKALTHLNTDSAFEKNEKPRRSNVEPKLKWQFQLDDDDRALLAGVPEAADVERLAISKSSDGLRRWEFFPELRRSRAKRGELFEVVKLVGEQVNELASRYGLSFDGVSLTEALKSDDEYTEVDFANIEAFGSQLNAILDTIPPAELTSGEDEAIRDLQKALGELASSERTAHPAVLARGALEARVPHVRLFDVADRDLQKEYDLTDAADNPPPALRHLADLAGLDLVALRNEILTNEIADASTRRNSANSALREVFRSWNQEAIALQLEVQGLLLHVQVTTPADGGLSSIDERSEGMRWFAMLLAFTHGAGSQPILLADEIETHLHYDAQADLVEVLSSQDLTSKVIYTTHSFGCLPNDLGNGVRAVKQTSLGTSTIEDGFWKSGSGFSPLLVSMGAAAVTFTPTRRAIIAEGATEAIVLPTILRQAAKLSKLDFQIAPGLSSVAAAEVGALDAEAGLVGYLVDGDPGGLAIKAKLEKSVVASRITVLSDVGGEAMETEDLFDPSAYAVALNDELRLWNSISDELVASDLPSRMRTKAVEAWCKARKLSAPDKGAVAQRLVNASAAADIYDIAREDYIVQLLDTLRRTLG